MVLVQELSSIPPPARTAVFPVIENLKLSVENQHHFKIPPPEPAVPFATLFFNCLHQKYYNTSV
jgi:hypothetical protein